MRLELLTNEAPARAANTQGASETLGLAGRNNFRAYRSDNPQQRQRCGFCAECGWWLPLTWQLVWTVEDPPQASWRKLCRLCVYLKSKEAQS
ncbi:MAG: hypothetical protein M3458_18090 [Acidobacteriota bacterium]|nr:hypothetical protein [Acidobacteriota bacterium]